MARWTAADIPSQSGRVAIVTGANSGIGYYTALELARKGATVILGCRNPQRGEEALAQLREELAGEEPTVETMALDLADLDSVRRFTEAYQQRFNRLDLLINNAGVMFTPLSRTAQGFEMQIGINHLGHFALTGYLLEQLRQTPGARIVNVASTMHRLGKIGLDDLNWRDRTYSPVAAYCQSKLANLQFTSELVRRSPGVPVIAAHPGWTKSKLGRESLFVTVAAGMLAQPTDRGALPTLRAAVDPQAESNDYFGPRGPGEVYGFPVKVGRSRAARNDEVARRLWDLSEELTEMSYPA